jgi:hypothetical protein
LERERNRPVGSFQQLQQRGRFQFKKIDINYNFVLFISVFPVRECASSGGGL